MNFRWTTLATEAIAVSGGEILKKGETTAFGHQDKWMIHQRLPISPESIDLTSCLKSADRRGAADSVEIKYISYVGTPGKLKEVRITIEAVMNLEQYKQDQFKHIAKFGISGFFGIESHGPMKANEAYLITKSSIVKIAESSSIVPSEVFETRLKCEDSICDLSGWHACFHVICREASGTQLAVENAYQQVKEAIREKIEAAMNELEREQQQVSTPQPAVLQQPPQQYPLYYLPGMFHT